MTNLTINTTKTIASLTNAFKNYEKALLENNLAILDGYFWESEFTVRFGVGENLYGASAIQTYRRQCTPVGAGRKLYETIVTSFGDSFGTVSTEFSDGKTEDRGRQMQTWVKFPEGWKVVAAHVSITRTA
jgi:hypothetical protein